MRIRYTDGALADIEAIQKYQSVHWPSKGASFDARLLALEARLLRFPQAAPQVARRPGVRVLAFIDFPFRLFYHANNGVIEVLAIRHTSRPALFE